MKQFVFAFVILLLSGSTLWAQVNGQELPASTVIPHYRLSVGYNTTTVLVFAAPVRPIDRGDRDILAIRQPGVDNVLKLKAARRNFQPTNLHVFTADGRIYAFDITYTDSLASSHDLTTLVPVRDASIVEPVALFSGQLMNGGLLQRLADSIRALPRHSFHVAVRRESMVMGVDYLGQSGALLFFRLDLKNRSNLPYTLDFLRCYVRDQRKARRTSIQDRELSPLYQDSASVIAGHSSGSIVLALPSFTLANGKQFVIEAYERGGGRSLLLCLHNRHLLRARSL